MFTSPGVTTQPPASITSSAGSVTAPTARITPSSIMMSPASSRRALSIVTMRRALRIRVRGMNSSLGAPS